MNETKSDNQLKIESMKVEENDNKTEPTPSQPAKNNFAEIEKKIKLKAVTNNDSLQRFATQKEMIFLVIGNIFSLAIGTIFPIIIIFFGEALESFSEQRRSFLASDNASSELSSNMSIRFIYGMFGAGAGAIFIQFLQQFCLVTCRRGIILNVKTNIYKSLITRDYTFWNEFKPQEITQFVENELTQYEKGVHERMGQLYLSASLTFTGITYCLLSNWLFFVIIIALMAIIFVSIIFIFREIQRLTLLKSTELKYSGGLLEEIFQSVKTVQYLDAKDWVINRYEKQNLKVLEQGTKIVFLLAIMFATFLTLFGIQLAFGIITGYAMINNEVLGINMRPGQVITIIFLIFLTVQSAFGMITLSRDFIEARAHATNLQYFVDHVNTIVDVEEPQDPTYEDLTIDIEDIKFKQSDSDERNTLENITMNFEAHKITSIVGESGSGKSTLIKIISRFYEPYEGNVKFNNIDVKQFKLSKVRDIIGQVNQEPVFFNFSLRDNMLLSNPSATDKQIIDVITSVDMNNWFNGLFEGLNTNLGNQGSILSGGEKQRLAIARALLKPNLKLLLLDEATAALDYKTEKKIYETIFKNQHELKFTCIIIAHRLKSIKKSDQIFVMSRGNLVEKGVHDDLVASQGLQQSLINSQENKDDEIILAEQAEIIRKKSSHQPDTHFDIINHETEKKVVNDFSLFDQTRKMININSEHSGYLQWGIFFCFVKGFVVGTVGFWYANLVIILLVSDDSEDTRGDFIYQGSVQLALQLSRGFNEFFVSQNLGTQSENLLVKLKSNILRSLLNYNLLQLQDKEYSPGNLATVFSYDVETIKVAGGQQIGEVIAAFISIGFAFVFAMTRDWVVPLGALTVLPLVQLSFSGEGSKQRRASFGSDMRKVGLINEDSVLLSESSVNWMTTQSLGGEELICQKQTEAVLNDGFTWELHSMASFRQAIGNSSMIFAQGIIFFFMSQRLEEDPTRLKVLIECLFLLLLTLMGNIQAFNFLGDIHEAIESCKKIFDICEDQTKMIKKEEQKIFETLGDIEFKNVAFSQVDGQDVFSNLNLTIHQNKFNAICGQSGGGKSTILNMMLKLYDVRRGSIKIGGVDINQINTSSILQRVGQVGQDSLLFDENVEENINVGLKERITEEQLNSLMIKVNASDVWDRNEPNSITRHLGLKGSLVSGGQRQRLAIARALARNGCAPSLLILDEATASLDGKNEEEIQKLLNVLLEERNCTILIVAHRLSTIRNADNINIISNGKVIEKGTHDELVNNQGVQYSMLNA